MYFFEKVIIAAIIAILVAIGYGVYVESQKPGFELKKDEWHCTDHHMVTTMVMVGKVMVPQTYSVCDNWKRNGYD